MRSMTEEQDKIIRENMELVDRYSFLKPRSVMTGDIVDHYDYTWTMLDMMPIGWKKAFGVRMCEELREALVESGCLDTYQVLEVKEKYWSLRWYSIGGTEQTDEIENRYMALSEMTCIQCGEPEFMWNSDLSFMPLCSKCADELRKRKETLI